MKKYIAVLLCLCLLAGCGAKSAGPVLTRGDDTMDADQFRYYFCYQFANVISTYGDAAFDPEKDLSAQAYDDTQSWQDFLIEQAMTLAEQTSAMCLAAEDAGYKLPQPLTDLESVTAETAKEAGYKSVDAYLTANYGEGADLEGYREFLEAMALASSYSEALHTQKQYTDAEIEAFYDSRAADYADTFQVAKNYDCQMDVRMIRFYPDDPGSAADWASAEERAQRVLEEFLQDPTDAHFAALADEKTEDFNSPAGGLYDQVCPNQMNDALNGWLFPKDNSRGPGDCEWIDDGDACVLCYVSAVSDRPYWMVVAENDLRYADYIAALNQIQTDYTFERHPENVDLRVPTAHTAKIAVPEGVEAVG